MQPFHLAITVNDLSAAREFYGSLLGCKEGRAKDNWIDFNFFGHQLSIHESDKTEQTSAFSKVDGKEVPARHFGVVLTWDDWHQLAEKLKSHVISFDIEPYIRFKGQTGEQATMFFRDPAGNALEFKSFKEMSQLFAA